MKIFHLVFDGVNRGLHRSSVAIRFRPIPEKQSANCNNQDQKLCPFHLGFFPVDREILAYHDDELQEVA